jgi:hypothetical protein
MNTKRAHQTWLQRLILLFVLAYEGLGGILGGILLVMAPDGRLMNIPTEILHGSFPDFYIPGLILTAMGILTSFAFIIVFQKNRYDWLMSGLSLVGFTIWFAVEIVILQEIHWLHIMWGVPVLVGIWAALPLIPKTGYDITTSPSV